MRQPTAFVVLWLAVTVADWTRSATAAGVFSTMLGSFFRSLLAPRAAALILPPGAPLNAAMATASVPGRQRIFVPGSREAISAVRQFLARPEQGVPRRHLVAPIVVGTPSEIRRVRKLISQMQPLGDNKGFGHEDPHPLQQSHQHESEHLENHQQPARKTIFWDRNRPHVPLPRPDSGGSGGGGKRECLGSGQLAQLLEFVRSPPVADLLLNESESVADLLRSVAASPPPARASNGALGDDEGTANDEDVVGKINYLLDLGTRHRKLLIKLVKTNPKLLMDLIRSNLGIEDSDDDTV